MRIPHSWSWLGPVLLLGCIAGPEPDSVLDHAGAAGGGAPASGPLGDVSALAEPSAPDFFAEGNRPPQDEPGIALEPASSFEDLLALAPQPRVRVLPADLWLPKRIVGADNRKPVPSTTSAPYSTIVTILMTFPDAPGVGLCTGSLIRPDAVLTAAHCVYDAELGGWAKTLRVAPGAYPDAQGKVVKPYGSASGKRLFAPSAYRTASEFWQQEPHDYAVIRLHPGIVNAPGTRRYGVMSDPSVGRHVRLVGYHGDLCVQAVCTPKSSSYVMSYSTDSVRELLRAAQTGAARLINHYADSYGGASGAPLVSDGALANTIFAVHVAGFTAAAKNNWNMGVLLTPTAVASIRDWAERAL